MVAAPFTISRSFVSAIRPARAWVAATKPTKPCRGMPGPIRKAAIRMSAISACRAFGFPIAAWARWMSFLGFCAVSPDPLRSHFSEQDLTIEAEFRQNIERHR